VNIAREVTAVHRLNRSDTAISTRKVKVKTWGRNEPAKGKQIRVRSYRSWKSAGRWPLTPTTCMEDDARSASPSSVSTYPAVSEDAHQAGAHVDPRRTLDLHHGASSSSSPDLNLKIKPSLPSLANASLSRTRTLPLRSPKRSTSIFPTLQGISFEVENVECLRRWVLGLAIGKLFCFLVGPYILACSYVAFSVDFDLEQGPLLSCIFPMLPLYPFEAENMFALFSVQCVPVEIELELVLSLHFPTRRYSRKVQQHIPFAYENKLRERIKEAPLCLIADVCHLRTASFTAFLISIKKGALLPSAGTLRYRPPNLTAAPSHVCRSRDALWC
jgi:hypothetical protein